MSNSPFGSNGPFGGSNPFDRTGAPTSRLFEDLTRLATGAASAMNGARGEFEQLIKQRLERYVAELDFVPREQFDAVAAMASKARQEQAELAERLAQIEARLAALESGRP